MKSLACVGAMAICLLGTGGMPAAAEDLGFLLRLEQEVFNPPAGKAETLVFRDGLVLVRSEDLGGNLRFERRSTSTQAVLRLVRALDVNDIAGAQGNCRVGPVVPNSAARHDITWFGPAGKANRFTVTSGAGNPACPQPSEAIFAAIQELLLSAANDPGAKAVELPPDGEGALQHAQPLFHGLRFAVSVSWRDFADRSGFAEPVPGNTETSAIFWFFGEGNWELLLKVLDGCAVNGHYWVIGAAATNIGYTLTILDQSTGGLWSYVNPLGRLSPAFADTLAFPCH